MVAGGKKLYVVLSKVITLDKENSHANIIIKGDNRIKLIE